MKWFLLRQVLFVSGFHCWEPLSVNTIYVFKSYYSESCGSSTEMDRPMCQTGIYYHPNGCHCEVSALHMTLAYLFFETGSHYVAQTELKLVILLPQSSTYWDPRHVPQCLAYVWLTYVPLKEKPALRLVLGEHNSGRVSASLNNSSP
jgi:hypothetical protein